MLALADYFFSVSSPPASPEGKADGGQAKTGKAIKNPSNLVGRLKTEVPRHNEIVIELARKICKNLDLPFVR